MKTYSGIATSVPNVPGAKRASPLPKPNARQWRQLPNTLRLMAGSNIGRRAGRALRAVSLGRHGAATPGWPEEERLESLEEAGQVGFGKALP